MSKNHPTDNIYSILDKLDALKPTPQETRFALVKEIRESVEAQGSIIEGVDAVQAKLARQFAESDFSKMSAAIQKTGKSKASADAITAAAGREKLGQKEMTRRSVAGRKDESYNPVKAVKQCAQQYMEMNGIHSVHDLEAEDIESIGGDCQMNYQDVCEVLGCNLPDSLGPVKSYDEHGDMEECTGCAMGECSVHGMAEGEITHKGGEKVPTKFGTLHKSKATVDTEKDVMTDKLTDPDADDSEPAVAKGRGRPKMDIKDRSQAKMPWGGKPPKDTYKHQKGSFVHTVKDTSRNPEADAAFARDEKIAKAKGRKISEGVNFKQMDEETRRNLHELLLELQNDIKAYEETGHCSETLKDFLTVHQHGKSQKLAQEAAMQQPVVGAVPANLNGIGGKHVPVAPTPSHDSITTGLSDFAQNKPERGQPFGTGKPMPEEADPLEEELAKLAELAGIQMGEESHGEYINDLKQNAKSHGKHEIHAFGQDLPVDEDAKLDPVGKEDDDINNDGNKDSTDDYLKNRREKIAKNIDEAQELIAMLRVAGLDTQQIEEALAFEEEKLKVSEPKDKPANAPKEKYFGIKDQLGTMNTGEADSGEKNNYGGRGDNPMKQQPNRPARPVKVGEAATGQLEARLAAEYESIKKVS